jgi:hypothetical protein
MGAGDHRPWGNYSALSNWICLDTDGIAPGGTGNVDGCGSGAVDLEYLDAANRTTMTALAADT